MVNLQVLFQHWKETLMYKDHTNLNALRFYLKVLNYVQTLLEFVHTCNSVFFLELFW